MYFGGGHAGFFSRLARTTSPCSGLVRQILTTGDVRESLGNCGLGELVVMPQAFRTSLPQVGLARVVGSTEASTSRAARVDRIDRSHLGPIRFGVVGPKRAGLTRHERSRS